MPRHLDKRGEGPHHITFTVPDLRASVAAVRKLGATVTGEDYSHPSWHEAFIAPDAVHGTVIQLAQSDATYPPPAELLTSRHRDVETYPSSAGATDRTWWTSTWDTEAEAVNPAVLGATHLASIGLDLSRMLFGDVLGADMLEHPDGPEFRWSSGTLCAHPRPTPGITNIDVTGDPPAGLTIGRTPLSESATKGSRA